ncbi:MAG: hypothetical protein IPP79_21210 [Chitinophagaceae bacterium]|nr:hypothetical protein [Chitinophagaceae bacterium]
MGNQMQLVDLDADGGKQLANLKTEPKGYFELSDENLWLNHKCFESLPNFNLGDPNIRND